MHLTPKIKFKAFAVILAMVGFSSDLYAAEIANPSSSLKILSFVEKGGVDDVSHTFLFHTYGWNWTRKSL